MIAAFIGLIGYAAAKAVVVNTAVAQAAANDTTTGTTTNTTTTSSGLPPPYDKPPHVGCSWYTVPDRVRRSKVRKFTIVLACRGLAKLATLQWGKMPKGQRFIGKGSHEITCTANVMGPRRCWQKRVYQMVNGVPTFVEHNLTPSRYGHGVNWVIYIHVGLSRHAVLGCRNVTFPVHAQNGQLSNDDPEYGPLCIRK